MRCRSLIAVFVGIIAIAAAQAQITVGVNLSTTGPVASMGIPNKNAVLLGPSVIAGQKIRYVMLDDGSDTTTAVQNVKRMIMEDNIDVLLGPTITPNSLAVLPIIAEAKLPMLSYGSSIAIIAPMDEKRRWAFKTIANDDVFVTSMLDHMLHNQVKKISMIAVEDAFGDSWVQNVPPIAARKGVSLLTVERFKRTDASTLAQALRAMQGNPDAIVIVAAGTPAVTPHRALVERGYKGKIYQSGGAVNADFLRVGGKIVEGSYAVQTPVVVAEQLPSGYPTKKTAVEFLKAYETKYGTRDVFSAFTWDSLKLLEAAIPVVLKTGAKPGTVQFREALRSALESSKGVVGASAVYTMSSTDHSGINQLGMSVMKVVNGSWKLDQAASLK